MFTHSGASLEKKLTSFTHFAQSKYKLLTSSYSISAILKLIKSVNMSLAADLKELPKVFLELVLLSRCDISNICSFFQWERYSLDIFAFI